MMTNSIKMMNDMELDMVAGGIIPVNQQFADCANGSNAVPDGFFEEAFGTAWKVVKHAFEVCG